MNLWVLILATEACWEWTAKGRTCGNVPITSQYWADGLRRLELAGC